MADLGRLPTFYEKVENVWKDKNGREFGKLKNERFENHMHGKNEFSWWIRLKKPEMSFPREHDEFEIFYQDEKLWVTVIRYPRRARTVRLTEIILSIS